MKRKAAILAISAMMLFAGSCEVANDLLGTVGELEGDWDCDETSEIFKKSTANDVYIVTISPDPDNINGVIIDNFYNVQISVKATVTGKSFIIPNQNAEDGYSVHGSGTINAANDEITLSYVVNDGSGDDNASAVYTKR